MRVLRIFPSILLVLIAVPLGAGQAPFEDVVRNLRNPDPKARLTAVRTLREARHDEAAVPVAGVVNDPVDEIQLEAITAEMAFCLIDDVRARRRVGLIVEVRGRGQASHAFDLGPLATWPRQPPPGVLDALIKAVDDENPRVRMEAIYAVGVVGRPPVPDAAADQLIKALDHYDPSIRAAAARVIGRLEVARAADMLVRAVNDSNPGVRFAAMRALGAIRETRAVQALTEQFAFYRKGEGAWSALDALARIGHASSVPLFKAHLKDKDPYLRRASAEGIGRSGDTSELAAIRDAASTDSSEMVRAAMAFAMVRSGENYGGRLADFLATDRTSAQVQEYFLELGPAAVPALTPSLADPDADTRAGAAGLVGAIGRPENVSLLAPLTKDRDSRVADAARVAIQRLKMRF